MQNTVVGVFDNGTMAKAVVNDLVDNGFDRDDIQVQASSESGNYDSDRDRDSGKEEGGIAGFFSSLFGMDEPSRETNYYGEAVRRGNTLVTVDVDDQDMIQCATDIMERHGAVDIDERASEWGLTDSVTDADTYTSRSTGTTGRSGLTIDDSTDSTALSGRDRDGNDKVLEVMQEDLHVGKRQVQGGKVRVYSRVTETPIEQDIQLRQEHINVERRPVDRPISTDEVRAFEDQTIEMSEMSEEAVVAKRARVVEEVVISKDMEDRTETVRDTVRRTDVDVEKTDGSTDRSRSDY